MKLLVFAHKPPPHHGQSLMVQALLDALGSDARVAADASAEQTIKCFHVDSRVSDSLEDVGQARAGKVFSLLKHCLHAIWCRFRDGVTDFYYVPAFPRRAPVYRDWIALGLCRPFFRQIIFHWHAVGLAEWLATEARPWERWISRWIYRRPDLSLVLRPFNRADAEAVGSRRIEIVPNGIPDPCPAFEHDVLPRRLARAHARKKLLAGESLTEDERSRAGGDPHVFRVLFLSLCHRGKGLFDTLDAVALANEKLRTSPFRIELVIAGSFWNDAERREFAQRIGQPDLNRGGPLVDYHGFVSGPAKHRLLLESDCLCFPTKMAESFGLVLVEGMAYGLPL
ncbi:MAG TPA: glycosyltransferase, partial [Verrucomicrobiae bacterium]